MALKSSKVVVAANTASFFYIYRMYIVSFSKFLQYECLFLWNKQTYLRLISSLLRNLISILENFTLVIRSMIV